MIQRQELVNKQIKMLEEELEKTKKEQHNADEHNRELKKQYQKQVIPTAPICMKIYQIKGQIAELKKTIGD